jgi:hypothetical protein
MSLSPRPSTLRPAYLLSLPERILRALAAGVGGLLFEFSEVALPAWLRRSRLYQALIYRFLRLIVELVGGVRDALPPDEVEVGDLAARKAVGNVIEVASFIAVGFSPLWLLAAASDLTGGTRAYLREFAAELREKGLLGETDEIQTVDELLEALEGSSGTAADLVDMPPLNRRDLARSWRSLQGNAAALPKPERLARLYGHMQAVAAQEGRSLQELSGLIASGALRAGVKLGSTHIFDYYTSALETINREGWWDYTRRVARPYLVASRGHFDPQRVSFTERALMRLERRSDQP